jgi:2-polyprenyl-6-methoxyphenol hydroxylase-like FAD-dependent oxidoreductase
MNGSSPGFDTDVLVVGAGPVGLTAACQLAACGADVTVIDRDDGPITQSRAIWVHSRTLELWEPIGIAGEALDRGVLVDRIDIRVGAARKATVWYQGEGRTSFPSGLMLEQSMTQRLLLARLDELGMPVRWQTQLIGFTQDSEGVTANLRGPSGTSSVKARWLLGCDGGSSTVRRQLGLTLEGGTYDSAFFLADVVGRTPLEQARAHLTFTGVRTVAWLPLPGTDRWRIIGNLIDVDAGHEPGYGRTLDRGEVQEFIKAVEIPIELEQVGWTTTYRSHHRLVPRYRDRRVFLAGDSAHLHSPAGGLGMNTGVADAVNLAWKLADVVAGHAPDTLLDTYEQERRPVAESVLGSSDRLFVLQADTRPALATIRRNALPIVARAMARTPAGKRLAFRMLSGAHVSYQGRGVAAPLPRRRGRPTRGGDRLPWIVLTDGITTHDLCTPHRHTLLVAARHAHIDDLAKSMRQLAERIAPDAAVVTRANEPSLVQALEGPTAGRCVAWVRPDRHLGWVGQDPDQLEKHLARSRLPAPTPRPPET